MLGTSNTRYGLLCEGLSSHNGDGDYVVCESLQDDRASCDTNLQFYFLVPWVSIYCYFGKLNDGFGCPHERCRGYSLYVRIFSFGFSISFLCFVNIVITNWISTIRQIIFIVAIEILDFEDFLIVTHIKARESFGYNVVFTFYIFKFWVKLFEY